MIFRPFFDFDHGCAAYLFGCGGKGLCAVVDPREPERGDYVGFAGDKQMRITHVFDTHVHADHRSAGPALAAAVGAQYCLHKSADIRRPFTPLEDGEQIELGNTRVQVLHTPGHTPESIALVVSGKPSSTIGFERRFNRALSLGREEFVDSVAVVAPKPEGSHAILEFNRGGPTA